MLNCFIFSDYDGLRDVRKKTDRIVNIDKEKYETNSLHSCYDFICKEIFCTAFEKSIQIYCTITILIICIKK